MKQLEQFIRGSVLGDGYISIPQSKGGNSYMTFVHSYKQIDYLQWKLKFLEDNNLSVSGIREYTHFSERYKKGSCTSYYVNSKSSPIFKSFRLLYYKNKKTLNREDFIKLDEFGLAIWYMDDGNIWNRKERSSCITLNTTSFHIDDVKFMIEFLEKKWKIKATYNKVDNTIRISVNSCEMFLNIIKDYIVPCMNYKTKLIKWKKEN